LARVKDLSNHMCLVRGFERACVVLSLFLEHCTWMAFEGNKRDLGLFWEETDEITTLPKVDEEKAYRSWRRRRNFQRRHQKALKTVSGSLRWRQNVTDYETLEDAA
ncbi:hypothetical protein Tco_0465627, partial [Tanacetum coccineum]